MRASVAAPALAAILAGLPTARAQMGVSPYHTGRPDTRGSMEKALDGGTVEQWGKRLDSDDARQRLLAVEDLGQSDDPHAVTYLLKAIDDRDLRIQARAIDYLGAHRASDATPLLVQKLYLKGAPDGLRQHVLTALGRIGDTTASRPILDFLSQEANPKLRGTGIYALGEIGDLSVQEDLRKIGDRENDPRLKGLVADALSKIARPPKQQYIPPSADIAPPVR
jgi:HEAT repeat protein